MKVEFRESDDNVLETECPFCNNEVTACLDELDACCTDCGADFEREDENSDWEAEEAFEPDNYGYGL